MTERFDPGNAAHRPVRAHGLEDLEHRVRVGRELRRLGLELPAAGGGELVVLGFAVVLGEPPLGLDPPALLEPVEGDVERPVLDGDGPVARVLDPPGDGVAVARSPGQRLEDEDVERALKQIEVGIVEQGRGFRDEGNRPLAPLPRKCSGEKDVTMAPNPSIVELDRDHA